MNKISALLGALVIINGTGCMDKPVNRVTNKTLKMWIKRGKSKRIESYLDSLKTSSPAIDQEVVNYARLRKKLVKSKPSSDGHYWVINRRIDRAKWITFLLNSYNSRKHGHLKQPSFTLKDSPDKPKPTEAKQPSLNFSNTTLRPPVTPTYGVGWVNGSLYLMHG